MKFPVFDLLVLSQAPNIGPGRLRTLVAGFEDPESIYRAGVRDFVQLEGFHKKISTDLAHFLRGDGIEKAKGFAEEQLSKTNKSSAAILTFWDKGFPDLLRKIYDPPAFLFCLGSIEHADASALAVVGTRLPSAYGASVAEKLSHEIAGNGVTVVSGLARGIDTIAHEAALKRGGRTIAVIGSGLDKLYPPENRRLADRIVEQGCLLSEFPMGTKPDASNFPRRNRIVSGMTLGTIIVETDINGGAMITASLALDQNREVFAVPGPVNSRKSRGCNMLIKTGRAKLTEGFDDITNELGPRLHHVAGKQGRSEVQLPQLTLFEHTVYEALTADPLHIDQLAEQTGLSTPDALVTLLNLEFKNLIRQLPGKMFVRL